MDAVQWLVADPAAGTWVDGKPPAQGVPAPPTRNTSLGMGRGDAIRVLVEYRVAWRLAGAWLEVVAVQAGVAVWVRCPDSYRALAVWLEGRV